MLRHLLSLLLIATLVLDGAASAWAMDGMHAGHGGPNEGSEQVDSSHDDESRRGHDHHLMAHSPMNSDGEAPPIADGSCCDEPSCQCGCILSMGLLQTAWLPPPCTEPSAPSGRMGTSLAFARTAPPLRPPRA